MNSINTLIDNIEANEDLDDVITTNCDLESGESDVVLANDTDEDNDITVQDSNPTNTAVPNNNEVPVDPPAAEPKVPSKMDLAKTIYARLTAEGKARKDIIKAFMDEAGLTKAGAATYYQKLAPKKS